MAHPRTTATAPNEECIAHGIKCCCQIERGGRGRDGKVWDEKGTVRWRYGVRDHPSARGRGNPFNKPEFVFAEVDGAAELVIRRASFVPSVFQISDGDKVTSRIRMVSLLRIKYVIEVDGVNSWVFRMPLFTVRFRGDSATGTDIWVVVGPSKMEWNILLRPGISDRPLLSALSFIHNEWWNYS